MGSKLLPLLVVWLCFTGFIYAANTFSINGGNLTAASTPSSSTLTIVPSGLTGPVKVSFTASPAGVLVFQSNSVSFTTGMTSGSVSYSTVDPPVSGRVFISFSLDNTAEYDTPSSIELFVKNTISYGGHTLAPGENQEGTLSLLGSPSDTLQVTLVSSPTGLVFTPNTFTFKKGQPPYELSYYVTSTQPGTYWVTPSLGGADASLGVVATPLPNVSSVVGLRSVKTTPVGTTNLKVGQTASFLVYVDISPDQTMNVDLAPSNTDVIATPSSLLFTSSTKSLTYTLSASKAAAASVVTTLSGPDSSKYAVGAVPSVSITNRTVNTPSTFNSVLLGVTSATYSVYVPDAPDATRPLTLSMSSPNNLVFTPSSLTFDSSNSVGTFRITASNSTAPSVRQIDYALSGTMAYAFTVPAPSGISIEATTRTVTANVDFNKDQVPFNASLSMQLVLDNIPPNSFTVSVDGGVNAKITPNTFTFTNSAGSLRQSLSFVITVLGSTRFTFSIAGVDQALVNPIPSILFTVIQYNAPQVTIGTATVGVPLQGTLRLPSPVISGLTVTFTTSPSSNIVSPSVFNLVSPGLDANDVSYPFTVTAPSASAFVLKTTLSGPDAGLFPSVPDSLVQVNTVSFNAAGFVLNGPLVVGVPVTGLKVTLNQPHPTSVTLTPRAASLTFQPASLVFDPAVSEVCFTAIPNQVITSDTVLWTSSDPTNYVAPGPIPFAGIEQKTFDLGDLTDTVTLVVGVQSVSFPVRVNYPPASGSVTLTPASTDGIVFNPAVLTFTPTVDVQYITLTSNSLANRDPVVTWTVSGAEAANFIVPDPINTISVVGRTLSVSGSFGSSLVNTPSTPIVITSDYVVGSLTITPSASDLVFTPASQTLSATSKFVAFTATYPTWKDTNSEVDIAVQFVFSGANAEWYNPLSAQNFHAVQRSIRSSTSAINLVVGKPGVGITFTTQVAPENGLQLTFCPPTGIIFTPAVVTFAAGQSVASTVVTADDVYGALPSTATIDVDVIGLDAGKYSGVASIDINNIAGPGGLSLSGFPSDLVIGDAPSVFQISVPFVESSSFTVTPVSQSGALTFVPSSATFSGAQLNQFFSVQATNIFHNSASASQEIVTFQINGVTGILGSLGTTSVTINKRSVTAGAPPSDPAAVGTFVNSYVQLEYPPASGTITLTAVSSPGLSVFPTTLTFANNSKAYYSVSGPSVGTYSLAWTVSGQEAAFYDNTQVIEFDFAPRSIQLESDSLNVQPGRLAVVSFALSHPVETALTVTPVGPSQLTTSPVTLSPGQSIGRFVFQLTGTNLFTDDASTLNFVLSGADASWYSAASSVEVTITTGHIDVQANIETEVGTPTNVFLELSVTSINGLTITPASPYATFEPAAIVILPGQSTARFAVTPKTSGSILVSFALSGADSWLYSIGTTTVVGQLRQLTIGAFDDEPSQPQREIIRVYLSTPPPSDVIVTPQAHGVEFVPSSLTFTPTLASQEITYVASTCGAVHVNWVVSGTNAGWYDLSSLPETTTTFFVECVTVTFDLPASFAANVATSGRAMVDTPVEVALTPSAPGCAFEPSVFNFDADTLSVSYTAFCTVSTAFETSVSIPVTYSVSGVDAGLVDQPVVSGDITVVPNVLTVPDPVETFSGQPVTLSFSLTQPPSAAFTLTPVASHVTFSPASFNFEDGTSATIVATPTSPTEPLTFNIAYLLSGPGSSQIGLSAPSTSLNSKYGTFDFAFSTLAVGEESGPFVFSVNPPPNNDLTLTPTAPGCIFVPPSIQFTYASPVSSFLVTCNSVGSPIAQFTLSGTDSEHYAIPEASAITVGARLYSIDFSGASGAQVFDELFGTIQLNTPTDQGLTITPHSSVYTFEPATIEFAPGSSYAPFKYTATAIGSDHIWFEEGDADADLYDTLDSVPVTVGPREITANIEGSVYTGIKTNTFAVVLDRAPNTNLVVRPYGAGAVFTPATLTFQPGQTGASCVLQAKYPGPFTIYYDVSGDDAEYYDELSSTSLEVTQLTAKFDLSNYASSFVGVASAPLLIYSDYAPSDTVRIDFVGDGFEPAFVEFSPTITSAKFIFTPPAVGSYQLTAVLSGNAAGDYDDVIITADDFFADRREIRTPNNLPDVFAGISSVSISFGVDYPPPNGFTITPSAANVVFTPSTLSFAPGDFNQEFTFVANQSAQYNNVPNQQGDLSSTTVKWTLGGADAAWYQPIDDYSINVVPRDIRVNYLQSQQLNIPFDITVTTTYPSQSDLVFTFLGNFEFSPATITLAANQTAVTVSALPLAAGSNNFRVVYSGLEAGAYQTTGDWNVDVAKWYFNTPDLDSAFLLGEWASPFIVRPSHVPNEIVTLTLSSEYLEVTPSTLTFGPDAASSQFSLRLRKGIDYLRLPEDDQGFTVYYWVGGPAAWLFSTPAPGSFSWQISYPPRTLTVNNFPSSLVVGVPSQPISVLIPNAPFDSLTITPVPYSPHIQINPPSVTLTRDSNTLLSTFTITADHPDVVGTVKFLVSGLDAVYYDNPEGVVEEVTTRYISFSTADLVVGIPSNPFTASIKYPIDDTLSVILSSPYATFNPSTLTFGPDVTSVSFSVTAWTYGSGIPVTVSTVGPVIDWFTPASFPSLDASPRHWLSVPGTVNVNPADPETFSYSVDTAPNSDITITPYGAGLTFTPESITLTSASSSATFTVIGQVSNAGIQVITTVTGTDAAWYDNVPNFIVNVGSLSIRVNDLNDEDIDIDLFDQRDLLVVLDAPVNGLNYSLSAAGLQFDQPWYYVPAGHGYSHASFIATDHGLSTVKLTVNGDDAPWYSVIQPVASVRVIQNYLYTSNPSNLLVGSQSGAFVLYSRGGSSDSQRAPPADVTVNFLVSPSGAASIFPENVTLNSASSVAQIQVTANIPSSNIIITPVLSGPGAVYYSSTPGQDPNPFYFASTKRSFTITDPFNSLAITNQRQLYVGERSHKFGVTCNGIPSGDVVLYLSGPGLQFIPSALRFTGTFETIYFEIIPTKAILTQITYSVGGADSRFYSVPAPSQQIRVTHQFEIPSLQPINVGVVSTVHTVTITSPLDSAVYLTPSTGLCASSVSPNTPSYVTFFPPYLLFTPNSTTQSFTYIGNCASNNLGTNFNPVITDASPRRYAGSPVPISVSWQVTEAGASPYTLSFPLNEGGVLAVTVMQTPFNVAFRTLSIGTPSTVVITVPVAPRSDVVLTLVGNNLNFNPPHAVFSSDVTNVTLEVTYVHRDFKDSKEIPFTVDYIVSGTNWQDFIPPAQSYLGVSRGDGEVVGGICGNDAGITSVSMWAVAVVAVFALLL